jgi:hypothetical protein
MKARRNSPLLGPVGNTWRRVFYDVGAVFYNEHKLGHGSRLGSKPKKTVLTRTSSIFLDSTVDEFTTVEGRSDELVVRQSQAGKQRMQYPLLGAVTRLENSGDIEGWSTVICWVFKPLQLL